ncbi:MAG: flagellar hook protein FlgE [Epsilonproteobacteria bacterium]|nr:flagellar hook protein FlgE [Campylobacterota bacterium]NPA56893.1 flagellar hook protein FlgE [Campylobacterota bacterium]
MLQSFYTGNTGLGANKQWLSVISDNIANVNTTGYKQEVVNFKDLLSSSLTTYSSGGTPINREIGGGSFVGSTSKDFSQGSFKNTNSPLNLALDGEGFFMVKNPNASLVYYTRDGNFRVDATGDIVNQSGYKLQGWMLDENGNMAGALGNIKIPSSINPVPTTQVSYESPTNLKADDRITEGPFNPANSESYNYVNTITTYDTLGTAHVVTQYFKKIDTNKWEVYTLIDDRAVTFTDGGNTYTAIEIEFQGNGSVKGAKYANQQSDGATQTIAAGDSEATLETPVFAGTVEISDDSSNPLYNDDGNGNLIDLKTGEQVGTIDYATGAILLNTGAETNLQINYKKFDVNADGNDISDLTQIATDPISYTQEYSRTLNDGANSRSFNFSVAKFTQLTSDYIFYAQQDGSGKGDLMTISVSEDGIVSGSYTNGQVRNIARLGIATFKDKEILVRKGDNLYLPSQQTFTPIIVPGGVLSKVRSGMLEMSNVDISQEFINLITAQRAYQANAKTITTSDQVLQTTMDIKR